MTYLVAVMLILFAAAVGIAVGKLAGKGNR